MPVFSLAEAEHLVAAALMSSRTSESNARSVARALVAAEADGLKGHGLSRVASYAAQAKAGKVDGFASPTVRQTRPAASIVDAAHGFAYPALELAEAEVGRAARSCGVAVAGIHRSHHCGAAGHPVERLAERGMVALMFANTPAAMAPWGGSHATFGTNPIAFACPLPDRDPLVIDLSLSKVARGNVVAAQQRGEAIPEGWALNAEGRPTTDPAAALAGTMLPAGDAKGTALALMVELLAAGLTGANFAAEASSFLDAEGGPPGTGQLLIALDPSAYSESAAGRFAALAEAIEGQPGARLPSVRRLQARRQAAAEGLKIDERSLKTIRSL